MLVKLKSFRIYTHFVSFVYMCFIQISCFEDQHHVYALVNV